MRLILLTHPSFLNHQSMPRFTNMLADGMRIRGHQVEVYSPSSFFSKLPAPLALKKWLGYIDQWIIFPAIFKKRIKLNQHVLYVFTDHALGMWVPLVKDLPNVVICHDFLAQRSAVGEIQRNPTSRTGRLYQHFIRKGYSLAKNFISVSKNTQQDLHRLLGYVPPLSKVVYNGLNKDFCIIKNETAREILIDKTGIDSLRKGYILHIGSNLWYKNRLGVIKIYNSWREMYGLTMPLLLIGPSSTIDLKNEIEKSTYADSIYFVTDIEDDLINAAYAGASVLLFPSHAEGFGWPIAEAMAAGCLVITTADAPMTEVGAEAAFYVPIEPLDSAEADKWVRDAATTLHEVLNISDEERKERLAKGFENVKRFDRDIFLNEIEKIFVQIIKCSK